MNKRLLVPVAISALLAVATMSGSTTGSGVALHAHGHGSPERDLIIEPGTDPSSIQLHFAGAQRINFSSAGSLEVVNQDGHSWRYRPEVYQMVNGKRKVLTLGFSFVGRDRVTLQVSHYDPSAPLIVTPVSGPVSGM